MTAAMAAASTAAAQTYCIDARPTGPLINSLQLHFQASDGRVVQRRNVVLKAIDPARTRIVIIDGEQEVELDYREWPQLRLDLDDGILPMAQRSMPKKSALALIGRTRVPIADLAVSNGIVRFPGCTMPADDPRVEIRFAGTLTFDAATGSAEIEGTQSRYDASPPSHSNPGAPK
jgi:hypothetical protein